MNAVRGTFRSWVVLALIGWTIPVYIALLFEGGHVSSILSPIGRPAATPPPDWSWEAIRLYFVGGGWPWEAMWLLGILVILAIGFLTRKRA